MYCLSKRQVDIVNDLLDRQEYVAIKELAEKLNVSSRTIRYDLDKIKLWLEENDATLIKKPNKGIKIETFIEISIVKDKLKVMDLQNRVLSKEEREQLIFVKIYSQDAITLDELCESLWISKATVVNDLKDIEKKLEKDNIKLVYKVKEGFQLQGNEEKIRKIIVTYIRDVLNINDIIKFIDGKKQYELKIIDYLSENIKIINVNDMPKIFKILDEAEKYMNIQLADDAYVSLAIHILIAIKRMRSCYKIEIDNERLQYLKEKKEYLIASYISKRIEETFDVNFYENEIGNIALHLMGAKLYKDIESLENIKSTDLSVEEEIIELNRKMIDVAEKYIGIDLKNDEQLNTALLLHLKPAIYRLKNDMKITNPLLQEIKSRYPFMYQAAVRCSMLISDYIKKDIPESEIGYIAMHLGAAFEKKYHSGHLIKAVVVCTSGMATSQLLRIRLENLLPELKIVATCSIKDLDKYILDIQLIISTVELKQQAVPVIKASPFLDEKDLERIRKHVFKISQINRFVHFNNINISNTVGRKELDAMLKDILTTQDIQLNVRVDNWRDAIKAAGKILIDNDKVTEKYVNSMIEAVENYGPYIVVMPGVAFAHARPCEEVKKPCMSLITLEEPVNFQCEDKDPIFIVFAFGSNNPDGHLTALQDLAKFLEKEENVEFLRKATNKEVVLKNIIEYEQSIED